MSQLILRKENAARREYIRKHLEKLIDEGQQFERGDFAEITYGEISRIDAWRARAERFLTQYGYESHVPRFKESGVIALEELHVEILG